MSSLRSLVLAALAASVLLLASCASSVPVYDSARMGPFFVPKNHEGEPTLGGIRRVVLLPVCAGSFAPAETAAVFDPVFANALEQQHRFEVVTVPREVFLQKFRTAEFSSVSALPRDFLPWLKREYAADAVIFVDLTTFRAYRPMALGLRAKLATLEGTRIVWTFDDLFTADNQAVANSARNFYIGSDRGGVPADLTPSVLQSPTRFAGYAAHTMFATLPPVTLPVPVPAKVASSR